MQNQSYSAFKYRRVGRADQKDKIDMIELNRRVTSFTSFVTVARTMTWSNFNGTSGLKMQTFFWVGVDTSWKRNFSEKIVKHPQFLHNVEVEKLIFQISINRKLSRTVLSLWILWRAESMRNSKVDDVLKPVPGQNFFQARALDQRLFRKKFWTNVSKFGVRTTSSFSGYSYDTFLNHARKLTSCWTLFHTGGQSMLESWHKVSHWSRFEEERMAARGSAAILSFANSGILLPPMNNISFLQRNSK